MFQHQQPADKSKSGTNAHLEQKGLILAQTVSPIQLGGASPQAHHDSRKNGKKEHNRVDEDKDVNKCGNNHLHGGPLSRRKLLHQKTHCWDHELRDKDGHGNRIIESSQKAARFSAFTTTWLCRGLLGASTPTNLPRAPKSNKFKAHEFECSQSKS